MKKKITVEVEIVIDDKNNDLCHKQCKYQIRHICLLFNYKELIAGTTDDNSLRCSACLTATGDNR